MSIAGSEEWKRKSGETASSRRRDGRAAVVALLLAGAGVLALGAAGCGGHASARGPVPAASLADRLDAMAPRAQLDTLRLLTAASPDDASTRLPHRQRVVRPGLASTWPTAPPRATPTSIRRPPRTCAPPPSIRTTRAPTSTWGSRTTPGARATKRARPSSAPSRSTRTTCSHTATSVSWSTPPATSRRRWNSTSTRSRWTRTARRRTTTWASPSRRQRSSARRWPSGSASWRSTRTANWANRRGECAHHPAVPRRNTAGSITIEARRPYRGAHGRMIMSGKLSLHRFAPGRATHVLLAMSGGVDSAVSALALLEAGYRVVGRDHEELLLRRRGTPRSGAAARPKPSTTRAPCASASAFATWWSAPKRSSAARCTTTSSTNTARGRTPNPCVRCNSIVRFDTLVEWADRMGYDYRRDGALRARVSLRGGPPLRARARRSRAKDQSYFLSALEPTVLDRVLFPLGRSREGRSARARAHARDCASPTSPTARKCVSSPRGRCANSWTATSTLAPGDVENTRGDVVGRHDGLATYTVGQRRGLGVAGARPQYVVAVDAARNAVVLGDDEDLLRHELECSLAWIDPAAAANPRALTAQIRSRHPAEAITALSVAANRARVTFASAQRAVGPRADHRLLRRRRRGGLRRDRGGG